MTQTCGGPHQAVLHSKRQTLGHARLTQRSGQPIPSDYPTPRQAPRQGVLKVRADAHGIQGIQHVDALEAGTWPPCSFARTGAGVSKQHELDTATTAPSRLHRKLSHTPADNSDTGDVTAAGKAEGEPDCAGRADDKGPVLAGGDELPPPPPSPAARSSPSSCRRSKSRKAVSRARSLGRAAGSAARHCASKVFSSSRRPGPPGVPSARTHHGMASPSSSATSSTLLPSRPGKPPRRPGKGTRSAVARRLPKVTASPKSAASQWKGGVPPVSSSYARLPTMYTSLAVVAGVPPSVVPAHTSGALHCKGEFQ
jgi:hypothetical protein